jgi:PAS domain S-box-containing protein
MRTITVLYVDDEHPPSLLSEAEDFALSTVETVSAARRRLTADGSVDCVVSEYDLPGASGLDLLESVRKAHPNLPFVLFTGSGTEELASRAIGMGVTDYLPKDACAEQLRERIGRAVAPTSVETDSGISGDRMRELTNAFPDVAFLIDENGRYLEVLSGGKVDHLLAVEQEQLVGKRLHDVFESTLADRFLNHVRTTLETGSVETLEYQVETSTGERWFEGRTAPLGGTTDGREAVVWVARDVTKRVENERVLARNRDQLTRLNRINGLINRILQSLVESATREEIERTVCEELANSEFYQFAWIGAPWGQTEQMSPSAIAGIDRERIERLNEKANALSPEDDWFRTVAEEGEPIVVPDVDGSERLSDSMKELFLEANVESAAVVPLSYGNTSYGLLGISGNRANTFSEREVSALETLAEVVTFAINALKNRNLIFSNTAVELEFMVRDCASTFSRISDELDCQVRLEGLVPVTDDRLIEYISFEGTSASPVVETLDEAGIADERRVVSDGDEGCLLEIVLAESGVHRLVKTGTVVKSAVVEDRAIRYVVEAPSGVDVRTVTENFGKAYSDFELVSKQEIDRPVHTTQEFRQTLAESLTDKQRTALQAAYFGGYYEYPRESTGEEVADSLDVSSPTLHQHLRAAQRKLVGTFLDP